MKVLRKAAILAAAAAAIFAVTLPAASQTAADPSAATVPTIEINNADSLRDHALAGSTGLDGAVSGVAVRLVVEYANTLRYFLTAAPDVSLVSRLQQISPRPLLGSAETTRQHNLWTPPAALRSQVEALLRRIEVGFAEAGADWSLAFPAVLLGDTVPPQVSIPQGKGAQVEWATDEFTSTVVRYGSDRHSLGQVLNDPVYKRAHKVQLSGMGPTTMVFCQITATDQSGNSWTTPVYQVSGTRYLYMPAVQR